MPFCSKWLLQFPVHIKLCLSTVTLTVLDGIMEQDQVHRHHTRDQVVIFQLQLHEVFQGLDVCYVFIHSGIVQEVPWDTEGSEVHLKTDASIALSICPYPITHQSVRPHASFIHFLAQHTKYGRLLVWANAVVRYIEVGTQFFTQKDHKCLHVSLINQPVREHSAETYQLGLPSKKTSSNSFKASYSLRSTSLCLA